MCPTCSHTMQTVCIDAAGGHAYWCPRCGTIMYDRMQINESPMLVDRCRSFAKNDTEAGSIAEFRRLGITESINLPEDREPEYEVKP